MDTFFSRPKNVRFAMSSTSVLNSAGVYSESLQNFCAALSVIMKLNGKMWRSCISLGSISSKPLTLPEPQSVACRSRMSKYISITMTFLDESPVTLLSRRRSVVSLDY